MKRLCWLAALLVTLAPLSVQAPAQAAKPKCTIVGTKHADVLRGTPGRDVICGRGAGDRIRGRGGNDIIRGGAGRDDIEDGPGADRVFGGRGADRMVSGRGSIGPTDRRSDVLHGGPGSDYLSGSFNDKLFGNRGDDDLYGQALKGGPGVDFCAHSFDDLTALCEQNREPAEFIWVRSTSTSLDVSTREATLVIWARLVDDLGVRSLTPTLTFVDPVTGEELRFTTSGIYGLEEGTNRKGVWTTDLTVDEGSPSGEYELKLVASERGLPLQTVEWTQTIQVTNNG